jgi:hypothetical protein
MILELLAAATIGYLLNKVEKMDSRIDEMEVKLAILQRELPRRADDSRN